MVKTKKGKPPKEIQLTRDLKKFVLEAERRPRGALEEYSTGGKAIDK